MPGYRSLKNHFYIYSQLDGVQKVLSWDNAITMPSGAEMSRATQKSTLSILSNTLLNRPEVPKWLAQADKENLEEWDARNLELMRQRVTMTKLLKRSRVRKIERTKAVCFVAYKEARDKGDWKRVKPSLEKAFAALLDGAKEAGDALGIAPYDYRLCKFAGSHSMAYIDPIFQLLREEIPPLMESVRSRQTAYEIVPMDVPMDIQIKVVRDLMTSFGYDFSRGRLDASASAFSSGIRDDSRIVTRFIPSTLKTVYSALHEMGHAIYKQNLPAEWQYQPVGSDKDLSLHESQALLYEKLVGSGAPLLSRLYTLLVQAYPVFGNYYSPEDFVRHMQWVKPSYIRIQSDEVTYLLHILLRYEIEKALFAETITVAEIPEMWQALSKELLGLDVRDPRHGCLQDVHWYKGKFGYFPTYAFGSIYAAQFMHVIRQEFPDTDERIRQGDMRFITDWLARNVHRQGMMYDAPDLVRRATGKDPSASYLIAHLHDRYI